MAKNQKITKKMNFMEIMEKNPDAVEILFNKGMHCIGCGLAGNETLEQGAIMHGINPDELVREINQEVKKIKNKIKKKKSNKKKKTKKKKRQK